MSKKKIIPIYEYAKMVGKSRQEIYRLIREKKLTAIKMVRTVERLGIEV